MLEYNTGWRWGGSGEEGGGGCGDQLRCQKMLCKWKEMDRHSCFPLESRMAMDGRARVRLFLVLVSKG